MATAEWSPEQVEAAARFPDMPPGAPSVTAREWQRWRRAAFVDGAHWAALTAAAQPVVVKRQEFDLARYRAAVGRRDAEILLAALGITVEES